MQVQIHTSLTSGMKRSSSGSTNYGNDVQKFEDFESNRFRVTLFWGFLIFFGSIQAGLIILVSAFTSTRTTDASPGNMDYLLYKNSRFRACAATVPEQTDCALLFNQTVIGSGMGGLSADETLFSIECLDCVQSSWCSAAACFEDYKIIPSLPRLKSFPSTALWTWSTLNVIALVGLWQARALYIDTRVHPSTCKGLTPLDWILNAYQLCSQGLWWYSAMKFITNPDGQVGLSLFSWVAPYRYAFGLFFHPYSCSLKGKPKAQLILLYCVSILTAIQMFITLYVFRKISVRFHERNYFKNGDFFYDCLEDQIQNTPGFSPCSARELCSKAWGVEAAGHIGTISNTIYLVIFLSYFVISLLLAVPLIVHSWWRGAAGDLTITTPKSSIRFCFLMINLQFSIYGFLMTMASVISIAWRLTNANAPNGTIVYDPMCRALHVAVSPWRYFLDISDTSRLLRLTQLWFSA